MQINIILYWSVQRAQALPICVMLSSSHQHFFHDELMLSLLRFKCSLSCMLIWRWWCLFCLQWQLLRWFCRRGRAGMSANFSWFDDLAVHNVELGAFDVYLTYFKISVCGTRPPITELPMIIDAVSLRIPVALSFPVLTVAWRGRWSVECKFVCQSVCLCVFTHSERKKNVFNYQHQSW